MKQTVFSKITDDIKVSVIPHFLDEYSEPADSHYVWSYTVQVENLSSRQVQLINRRWIITNAIGQTEEVQGPGVIGEQPVLKPGEGFRYTSGTTLNTPSGIMVGAYEMQDDAGTLFPIEVPAFSLDSPYDSGRPN